MISNDVIKSFKKGKKKGFDAVYEAYSPGMYAICLRYSRCADDAQDILQEAFIKVYNYRERYDSDKPIGAWIKTIVIRTALNYIRETYRLTLTDNENDFNAPTEYDYHSDETTELRNRLKDALSKLPEGYRTVFNLYTIDNLTHKEIAEFLGISEGTSKSQYAKAKKMIRNLLQPEKVAS